MSDTVNMSLDDIIKQNQKNRASRSRGRGGGGGGSVRGRGTDRGGVRGRGRGRGGGRGRGRGIGITRSGTPRQGRSRSRSQGPRGRSQSRSQSQTRALSRSRQQRHSTSRARSASRSRSRLRGLTPKRRAGLEDQLSGMPPLVRSTSFTLGGRNNRPWQNNASLQSNVHARLGVSNRRGNILRQPLALSRGGISKRGRRLSTNNRYSSIGLRSDQILKEQQQNFLRRNNVIKSQTFTRTRNNSFSSPSQLTVSVANDFIKRRRNSFGNAGYLNKQSLAQLNNQFGGYNTRRGPGSVKSMGSNRSNWSNRSRRSYQSNNSNRSNRSRGRGRGRGTNRGVSRKFVNKQVLNPKLQKEIAAIQGRSYGTNSVPSEAPGGVNFTPTPAATTQSLHQRFAST